MNLEAIKATIVSAAEAEVAKIKSTTVTDVDHLKSLLHNAAAVFETGKVAVAATHDAAVTAAAADEAAKAAADAAAKAAAAAAHPAVVS